MTEYGAGEEALRQAVRRLRRPSPPPEGLPGDLCTRLETGLLFCMPRECAALFVDDRIAQWKATIPEPGPTIDQVRALIDYLFTRYNAQGENALWLFLTVLGERTSPADACYRRLCLLSTDLHRILKGRRK